MSSGRDDDGLDAGEEGEALASASGHEHEPYARDKMGVVVAVLAPGENHKKVAINDSSRANR
jgi:hypothetical protein